VLLHKAIKLEQLDLPIKQVLTIKDTKLDLLMQDILLVLDKLAMILQQDSQDIVQVTTAQTYNPLGYEQNISRFMSPYQQNVTDIEKREAARQSEIMGKGIGDQATAQGGLGGYREAIQQSERERNLSQQMGDIQTRGSQAAYQNAQAQLERERAGGMGAARFGLDAFTQQQAAQQQQEQLAQRAFETSEQSRQQQETFAQSAFNAGESARQQAAQLGLSAQQQEEAARQAQEKFSQSGYQMQQSAQQQQGAQQLQAFQAQQQAYQQQGAQGLDAYQSSRSCSSSSRTDLDKVHTICLIAITWLLLKAYKALVVLNKQMCFLEYKLYKALVHKTEPYDKQVWTWDTMIFKDKETFLNNSLVTLVVC
jgi:hypothetical protein